MRRSRHDPAIAAAILAAGLAFFACFRPWTRPVLLDAATWDWMAVEMTRGMVPYRDVFLHKTPGAALVGALGARAGQALGIEPVLAAHALFLVLGALAPALLYLACRPRLARGAALAAAVALLGWDEWTIAALEGCRPKVPTVVFGLASMVAAERGRGVAASVMGGLSVLCWQPGVAFLLGSWASLVAAGERRVGRMALWAAAALAPSAVLLAWFAAEGALGHFWEQAILFNLHYIDDKARTPFGTLRALSRTFGAWNSFEMLVAPAALAGLAGTWRRGWSAPPSTAGLPDASGPSLPAPVPPGGAVREARRGAPASRATAARRGLPVSLVVSGTIYAAMVFVSFQSWPDAILLGPVAALLVGVGVHAVATWSLAPTAAAAVAATMMAAGVVPDGKAKFRPSMGFAEQRARYVALAEGIDPDARVVAVSVPEFFLHTGRRNGWKWPYFWFGVDEFAADHAPGGFDGILADLEARPPALILAGRIWSGPQRDRFEEWAASRYQVRTMRLFPHLKHPLRIYRLRSAPGSS